MAGVPMREAMVVVVDVGRTAKKYVNVSKEVVSHVVQQKMMFYPRDEVGLMLMGCNHTKNRLNAAMPSEYKHLSLESVIAPSTVALYEKIDGIPCDSTAHCDMMSAIVAAADAIHERVGDKRFRRRIFMLTDAAEEVKSKEELPKIVDALKARDVSLVVVGFDFVDPQSDDDEDDWTSLSIKQQNERVLSFMVDSMGHNSVVIPASDAVVALGDLQKKSVLQRACSKLVLSVGGLKAPVQVFTKNRPQGFPKLRRAARGEDIVIDRKRCLPQTGKEVDTSDQVKGYSYGMNYVPCHEVDVEQLKFKTKKGFDIIAFVPLSDVPPYLAAGCAFTVGAVDGDDAGATTISSIVQGMAHLQRAMLVRYVWRDNAEPVLCAAIPKTKPEKDYLVLVPIPFADDVRPFKAVTAAPSIAAADARVMEEFVDALDLSDVLSVKSVHNPILQHFYQALRDRLRKPSAPFPTMDASIRSRCCRWDDPANVVAVAKAPKTEKVLKRLREVFPPSVTATAGVVDEAAVRSGWLGDVHSGDDDRPGKKIHVGPVGDSLSTADPIHTFDGLTHSTQRSVGTIEPAADFLAMVNDPGADNFERAAFQVQEVIFTLLRGSYDDVYYQRCSDAVKALRTVCVREEEAETFNRFLKNLGHVCLGSKHEGFWSRFIVDASVGGIDKSECAYSSIPSGEGVKLVRDMAKVESVVVEEDANDEDIFDLLE